MIPIRRATWGDWLRLLGLVVFWGASFALTKIAVASLTPEWTVALRLILGAAIVYGVMRWEGLHLPTDPQALLWFVGLGIIGAILPFFLISWGTQYLPSGLSGILMAATPLAVIFLAHFALPDEPLTPLRAFGFFLGFAGVVILIGPAALAQIASGGIVFWAELAVLGATVSYALQSVLARRAPPMHFLQKTTGVLLAAALGSVPLAILTGPEGPWQASLASWLAVVALGVFPTALAGILMFRLLEQAGAAFVSLSNYLISPFAYFLGVLLLSEPFHWRALLGLLVILSGIAISEGAGAARRRVARRG